MSEEQAKEVLRLAEFPSLERVVVGIENLRDVLGEVCRPQRGVVARVEYLKVELLAGPGTPEA